MASAQARAPIVDHLILSTKHPVVAVIDDDLCVLDAMSRLLSTHGFDTERYDSPAKFLEAVMTTRAICLIVDTQLSDSCGVEFVRQLANVGITFPVIFITDNDNDEIEIWARETGCVALFRKPFSAYLLIEALNDLPNSYAVIRPRKS
jgi:FixJ family two-component response regulator